MNIRETGGLPQEINPLFSQDALDKLLAVITDSKRSLKFDLLSEDYNIKDYNIEEFSVASIQEHYAYIIEKYKSRQMKRNWCEHELRIFVWLVFSYAAAIQVKPEDFTEEEWASISSVFYNKSPLDCRFELLSISKAPSGTHNWIREEDELLKAIVRKVDNQNKWNDIAKELYRLSGTRFLRKPKQCRERWRNYLDPCLQKGDWTVEEDKKLLELVLEMGIKWSAIAKKIKTRTEHSVKNRFKSLLKKFTHSEPSKFKNKKRTSKDMESVKKILQQLNSPNLKIQKEPLEIMSYSNIKEPSTNSLKERKQKDRDDLDRYYPLSPNSAFRPCENRRTDFLGAMVIVSSPRILSPTFKTHMDWNDTNRDAYFLS